MEFLKELNLDKEEQDPRSYPVGSEERTRPWLDKLDMLHERFMNLVRKYELEKKVHESR